MESLKDRVEFLVREETVVLFNKSISHSIKRLRQVLDITRDPEAGDDGDIYRISSISINFSRFIGELRSLGGGKIDELDLDAYLTDYLSFAHYEYIRLKSKLQKQISDYEKALIPVSIDRIFYVVSIIDIVIKDKYASKPYFDVFKKDKEYKQQYLKIKKLYKKIYIEKIGLDLDSFRNLRNMNK